MNHDGNGDSGVSENRTHPQNAAFHLGNTYRMIRVTWTNSWMEWAIALYSEKNAQDGLLNHRGKHSVQPQRVFSLSPSHRLFRPKNNVRMKNEEMNQPGWWFLGKTPLKNDGVRQLG